MHATRRVKPVELFDAAPCSEEDAAWAAQAFATDTFRLDAEIDPDGPTEPDWDALYREAMFLEMYTNGHVI